MSGTDVERLRRVHERLASAVEELTVSDGWRRMLAVAARLPAYSPQNLLLIASQRPDATRVMGYAAWRQLGRRVRKGERGIAILAPVSYRRRERPDRESTADSAAATHDDDPDRMRVLRGFRVVHVFDVAQTDGPPLPQVRPRLLEGAAPPGLWDALAAQVAAAGYALHRADCAPANGVTDHRARSVTVAPDLSDAQAVKTLAHELGHVLAGASGRVDRAREEVVAESVAFVVMAAHGLDAGSYSFAYVAGWSGGRIGVVLETAERVLSTAAVVLAATTATSAEGQPAPPAPTRERPRPFDGAGRAATPAPHQARLAVRR